MPRVLLFMFVLSVTVYAAVDCINAPEEDRRGLPRGLWLILIIMLPIFGPVAWYVVSSGQRRARLAAGGSAGYPSSPSGASSHPAPRTRPSRPVAPDDDPEFLWRIEQERRRAARDQGARERDTTSDSDRAAGPDDPSDASGTAGDRDEGTPNSGSGRDSGEG